MLTLRSDNKLNSWLDYIQQQHIRTIDLSLSRVRRVWHALGAPNIPFTLLVAGTNGKGSSVAMLESILYHAGWRTGTYTSPHLIHYNERIRINCESVCDDQIIASFVRIEKSRGHIPLTYFEYGTLAAMLVFAENQVEACILEVGLGGRLDATNIFNHQLSLVTSIGLDHQSWLGNDREAIGREKGGIIRYHGLSVCADPDPPCSLVQAANSKNSQFFRINHDFSITATSAGHNWHCTIPNLATKWQHIGSFELPFMGQHQLQNAAGVIMSLVATQSLTGLQPAEICAGLLKTRIKARQQIVATKPQIILDVAHNQEAVDVLIQTLGIHPVGGQTYVVMGILADKPVQQMVIQLSCLVDHWYLATLNMSRGLCSFDLKQLVRAVIPQASIQTFHSPTLAYHAVLKQAGPEDRVLILGSFYTVGDIMRTCSPEQ